MIPYDFKSPHVLWWDAWRSHIRNAKLFPSNADGYCRAALISQAYYVINLALELSKEKRS